MQTQTSRFPLPAAEFAFAGFTWPRFVADLPKGTMASRLAKAKNRCTGPYYHAPKPAAGRDNGKGFYLSDAGAPGLRWTWCDEVEGVGRSIDHTGWFTDNFGTGEKIRGLVFRLPHERGFLAGWSMGEGMASALEYDVYPDEISAAHAADSLAESAAEDQREFEERERAENDDSEETEV